MQRFIQRALCGAGLAGVLLTGSSLAQGPAALSEPPKPEAAAIAQPANPPKAVDVPVGRAVLFSSGVGYFEHYGKVAGDGSAELRFKTEQINDILKSLVLQDLDGGTICSITYPSQDPISKTLASFQININGNPPLADLLNQLRGAKITITLPPNDKVTGIILGVEKKTKPVGDKGQTVDYWAANLLQGAVIRPVSLDDMRDLTLDDPGLQGELAKALTALAQARDQDKKPVTINFRGKGERRVKFGYVVEQPIWKTSYRLILPAEKEAKGKLQGWAIVENQTDNDWKDVQLSLVSGRPISFIQDLYSPLYIPRPVVQPELFASLRPQTYDAGMEREKQAAAFGGGQGGESYARTPAAAAYLMNAKRANQAKKGAGAARGEGTVALGSLETTVAQSDQDGEGEQAGLRALRDQPLNAAASIASVASAAKMGELFQYTVGDVTLPRQRSAMLPIVADDVEVERVSIYNQAVLPKNPLNGARLKNTTGKNLLNGPITVLDAASYAGDAKIDNLPPNQERLLSYGIDLQVLVDATKNKNESALQTGKIVKGVLVLTRKLVSTQEYLLDNKADKDKTIIVEHPLRRGWKLVDSPKPIETTEALYRFKDTVKPGQAAKLVVKEEIVQDESLAILPCDIGQLLVYTKQGEIPPAVKDALAKAITFKQAMVDTQRQLDEKKAKINEITQEQDRIRRNMQTVKQQSDYYNRLLTKLNEQETTIEKLQAECDDLTKKLDAQRKELEDYLSSLTVG